MKDKKLQLCIASAGGADTDLDAIRKLATDIQTCVAGLEDIADEPLKSKFVEAKGIITKALAGISEPPKKEDEAPDMVKPLLGILGATQSMLANVQESAKASATALATTKASIPAEIKSAIDTQIASGDLITKEQHGKLVADATATATTAARAAALTELKRVSDRKLALTTASLPVPSDEVLAKEDADFDARKATAAARVTELEPFRLPAERVLALAWDTDQAAYDQTLSLCKTVLENAKKPGTPPNPMLNRTGSDSPKKTLGGVC
jgi:hypothetical protein